MPRKTKYNNLTSPELLEQVNTENKELKRDFLNYLRSTQHSPGTINGYAHDIDIWCVWNLKNAHNKPFTSMTKRDLINYQNWITYENENSPARIRRLKATLSSWSNYIEDILDDEYPGYRSIVRKVKSPGNRAVREKSIFTDDDMYELLDTLLERKEYMKVCAVALAMFSGRRKSELPRFKVSWFTDENVIFGSLYKTPEKVKTKGHDGGKYIYCYTLKNEFKPYLDDYLRWRDENGIESEWLLYDKADPTQPLKESTLNSWAYSFSSIMKADFYWHSLRHFYTTKLKKAGLPDSAIQLIVGWASADLVRLYDDTSEDEQLEAFFDEGGIRKDIHKATISDL